MESFRVGQLPASKDMSHHLSQLAKERRFSPLKSFAKYMFDPSVRSLAGGLPNPGFFPFETISSLTLSPTTYLPAGVEPVKKTWLEAIFSKPKDLTFIETKRYASRAGELNLATALQYGAATGQKPLVDFIRSWTQILTPPAYSDWDVLLNDGSTDGFHKIVELLCEHGDGILVESFTYPSALETGWPMGVRPVTVEIDDLGLIPEKLEERLANWDDCLMGGMRRPRVLYTIPIGQNPCGSTLPEARRAAIYAIACKYDVIIVEDDPYHSLNFGKYGSPAPNADIENDPKASEEAKNAAFVSTVGKSYLRYDVEGRVIRIDTFSKTIAPGCRLGWTTSNALFAERLLRASETSTQQPSGPVQVLVANLLQTWGLEGWQRWLRGLRGEYGRRRDWMISSLVAGLDIDLSTSSTSLLDTAASTRYTAYLAPPAQSSSDQRWNEKTAGFSSARTKGRKIVSFVPPTAGMFVWLDIHLGSHVSLRNRSDFASASYQEDARDVMQRLWVALAEGKVLVAPGWMFEGDGLRSGAPKDEGFAPSSFDEGSQLVNSMAAASLASVKEEEGPVGHFRLAFATLEEDAMKQTCKDFSRIVKDFFA